MTEERLTEELLDELLRSESAEQFVETHDLPDRTLSDYLQQLLAEKGMEQATVVNMADLHPTYGYDIFRGLKKHPGRDKVLQIAFAMALTPRETNRCLELAGVSSLYPKVRRDAIILYCLNKSQSLQKVNEELYRLGEDTIC
ncbi:MAG: XRE family transcriptional regulator [Olegusella sp.]|nr:XRE family transcriptional regulator [Olegusella sp.]